MANRVSSRSRTFVRGGVARRETQWISIPAAFDTLAASAAAVLSSSLNAVALALRPFTVVRTHLNLLVISDQGGASEFYIGNVGFAVVSDQAVAIGISAVPTPATDLGSDLWFLHSSWMGQFERGDTTGFKEDAGKDIDSKAMRKVNADQDIVIVKEAGIGSSGCIVGTVGRMLIKLH